MSEGSLQNDKILLFFSAAAAQLTQGVEAGGFRSGSMTSYISECTTRGYWMIRLRASVRVGSEKAGMFAQKN